MFISVAGSTDGSPELHPPPVLLPSSSFWCCWRCSRINHSCSPGFSLDTLWFLKFTFNSLEGKNDQLQVSVLDHMNCDSLSICYGFMYLAFFLRLQLWDRRENLKGSRFCSFIRTDLDEVQYITVWTSSLHLLQKLGAFISITMLKAKLNMTVHFDEWVSVCRHLPANYALRGWTFAPWEPVQGSRVWMVPDMCLIRECSVWESGRCTAGVQQENASKP